MARAALTVTSLTADAAVDVAAAGTTGDATNGHFIASGNKSGNLIVLAKNTNAAAQTVTFLAGAGGVTGPAWRSMVGNLVVTIPATTGQSMIHLTDTARFTQTDGSINVDASHANVSIAVFAIN